MQSPNQYRRRRLLHLLAFLSASSLFAFLLWAAFQYPQITSAANTHTAAAIHQSPFAAISSGASIFSIPLPLLHFLVAYTLLMLAISIAGTLLGLMLFEHLFPVPVSSDEQGVK